MLEKRYKESLQIIFEKSEQTIYELTTALNNIDTPWGLTFRAGVGALLGDLYMSIERILRLFIEGVYGEKIIKDDSWHKHLIEMGSSKGILPAGVEPSLQKMRRFRHRMIHGYSVEMDESKLRESIPDVIDTYRTVVTHILRVFPNLTVE
jgi:uncharacterized protein YutE (UPF0331/DUF86 family)